MSFYLRLAIALIVGSMVMGLAAAKWRAAGRSLLFILIFEGVFRKWLLPSASDYIYFFKDWVLIGCIFGLYWSGEIRGRIHWRGLPVWLWLIMIFVSLEALNPAMNSPIAGIMGVKMWMLWPLFVFVVPRLFDDIGQFQVWITRMTITFFFVAGLAMVQFRLPDSHILNQYVRPQEGIAAFGDRGFVRVCSTFPYLAGYTNYLAFCPVIFLPAAIYIRGRLSNVLQYAILPLLVGVSSMSGARSALYYLSVYLPVFFVMGVTGGAIKPERVFKILAVAAALTLTLFLSSSMFSDALTAMLQRNVTVSVDSGDSVMGRAFGGFMSAFEPRQFSLLGEGVGSTEESSRNIAGLVGMPVAPSVRYAESEPGRVMIETGFAGLVLWTGFKFYLIGLAWVMYLERKEKLTRAFSLAVFLFLLLMFPAAPSFDHTLAPFYWFNVGLLFLMEKFDRATASQAVGMRKQPARHRRAMFLGVGR